jgi:hypothetical protein
MAQIVARSDFMAGLANAGLLPSVQAAVDASGDTDLQLAWADDQRFDQLAPTTQRLIALAAIPAATVNAIFGG